MHQMMNREFQFKLPLEISRFTLKLPKKFEAFNEKSSVRCAKHLIRNNNSLLLIIKL